MSARAASPPVSVCTAGSVPKRRTCSTAKSSPSSEAVRGKKRRLMARPAGRFAWSREGRQALDLVDDDPPTRGEHLDLLGEASRIAREAHQLTLEQEIDPVRIRQD